jgi:hypothetical protein
VVLPAWTAKPELFPFTKLSFERPWLSRVTRFALGGGHGGLAIRDEFAQAGPLESVDRNRD